MPQHIFAMLLRCFTEALQSLDYGQQQVDEWSICLIKKRFLFQFGSIHQELHGHIFINELFDRIQESFMSYMSKQNKGPTYPLSQVAVLIRNLKTNLGYIFNEEPHLVQYRDLRALAQDLAINYEEFYVLKLVTWETMGLYQVNVRTQMRVLEQLEKFRYWLTQK